MAPRTVIVSVPTKVASDLKSMQKVQAEVLGRLGCPNCHSGIDILFREDIGETNFSVNAGGQIAVARAGG